MTREFKLLRKLDRVEGARLGNVAPAAPCTCCTCTITIGDISKRLDG